LIGDDQQRHRMDLVDLSDGGLRAVVPDGLAIAIGSKVGLELPLGNHDVAAHARVVYEHDDGTLGLQFLDPSPTALDQIHQFLTTVAG
jgi:c-di-GMP-binding flagellar brake protein YcgR